MLSVSFKLFTTLVVILSAQSVLASGKNKLIKKIDESTEDWEFQCRQVNSKVATCEHQFSCPAGYAIKTVKAACNLERSTVEDSFIQKLASGTIAVPVPSTRVEEGQCAVGGVSLNKGSKSLKSLSGEYQFAATCTEKDLKSGADCIVRGIVRCAKVKPSVDAVFTTPDNRKSDTSIFDKLVSYVDAVPRGETIHVSIYLFIANPDSKSDTAAKLSTALKNAVERGVNVKIISSYINPDEGAELAASQLRHLGELKNHFAKHCDKKAKQQCVVKICGDIRAGDDQSSTSCLAPDRNSAGKALKGINHNKFILISKINPIRRNIVLQTSHNFTHSETKKFNDLLVMENEPVMYGAYLQYWGEQSKENKAFKFSTSVPTKGLKTYFFPDQEDQACKNAEQKSLGLCHDILVSILKNVSCKPGAGHKIRLAYGSYGVGRTEVFNRLNELKQQGCDVQLVVKDRAKEVDPVTDPKLIELKALLNSKKAKSVVVLDSTQDNVHSKIMLIDAIYTGVEQGVIFTGSHNLTTKALRTNDEIMVRVLGRRDLFDRYMKFWDQISQGEKSKGN